MTFYENIGEVSLPDIGNGYCIHSLRLVIQRSDAGEPRRLGPPFDVDVLAFASDGGGALYVLPASQAGPVYRPRSYVLQDGVADAGTSRSPPAISKNFCNA